MYIVIRRMQVSNKVSCFGYFHNKVISILAKRSRDAVLLFLKVLLGNYSRYNNIMNTIINLNGTVIVVPHYQFELLFLNFFVIILFCFSFVVYLSRAVFFLVGWADIQVTLTFGT